jgi:hypothetical protein
MFQLRATEFRPVIEWGAPRSSGLIQVSVGLFCLNLCQQRRKIRVGHIRLHEGKSTGQRVEMSVGAIKLKIKLLSSNTIAQITGIISSFHNPPLFVYATRVHSPKCSQFILIE